MRPCFAGKKKYYLCLVKAFAEKGKRRVVRKMKAYDKVVSEA